MRKLLPLLFAFFLCPLIARASADPKGGCAASSGVTTSVSCNYTPSASGSFYHIAYTTFGLGAAPGVTIDNTPTHSTWNLIRCQATSGTAPITCIYCGQVNSASAQTFTGSDVQPATPHTINVEEFANITSCTPNGTAVSAFGLASNPTSVSPGNITTSVAARIISTIFTCTLGGATLNTAGSGYTKNSTTNYNASPTGCVGAAEVEDRFSATSGTFGGAWTIGASTGTDYPSGNNCGNDPAAKACWTALITAYPSGPDVSFVGFPYIASSDPLGSLEGWSVESKITDRWKGVFHAIP